MRTLKGGAAAYLTKESAPEELVLALRKVFAGGQYVSARLAEYLVGVVVSGSERLPHEKLTDRELEVLREVKLLCPALPVVILSIL